MGVETDLSYPKSTAWSGPRFPPANLASVLTTAAALRSHSQTNSQGCLAWQIPSEHSSSAGPMARAPKHSDLSDTTKVLQLAGNHKPI